MADTTRKTVERLASLTEAGELFTGRCIVVAVTMRALLTERDAARAEVARLTAALAESRHGDALLRASERMKQLEIERDEAAGAAKTAEAALAEAETRGWQPISTIPGPEHEDQFLVADEIGPALAEWSRDILMTSVSDGNPVKPERLRWWMPVLPLPVAVKKGGE